MPELPEVQTVVNDLQVKLAGQTIDDVKVSSAKQVSPPPARFIRQLRGRRVASVSRRAKVVVFHLDRGLVLVGHMKMTGQFIYRSRLGRLAGGGHPFGVRGLGLPNRYTQVQLNFRSGDSLYFNDTRKFGYLRLYPLAEWQRLHEGGWGVDPFDRTFTPAALLSWARRRPKVTIKQLIMDQALLAGVGNIYADESLFRASIDPRRRAQEVTAAEARALVAAIRAILKLAVAKRGTTVNDYLDGHGNRGTYSRYLKVYGRGGQPCVRCRQPLRRTTVGGRGTVYCARCQR